MAKLDTTSRRLAFLEDTVKYYSEDTQRRATAPKGGCKYRTEDGRMCAIGRHLITYDSRFDSTAGTIKGSSISSRDDVFAALPTKIQELGRPFLHDVQLLHDSCYYWDKNGLTEEGKQQLEYLMLKYELA